MPLPSGHHSRCVRPCFQGLPGRRLARRHCDRAPCPSSAVEVTWLYGPISSRLLLVARLRLLTLVAVDASLDQVPRGQRAPLDHFRTLLIDRSADLVESPLPVHGRPWRRSLRAPDSQRPRVVSLQGPCAEGSFLVCAHFRLVSSVSSRFAPVVPLSILSFSCHTALLTMPAASGCSSTATSCWQSCDGGTPRPTPLALQVCDREVLGKTLFFVGVHCRLTSSFTSRFTPVLPLLC